MCQLEDGNTGCLAAEVLQEDVKDLNDYNDKEKEDK